MTNGSKTKLLFVVHGYNNKAGVEEHVKLLVSYLRGTYQISVCFPEAGSIFLVQDGAGILRYPGDQIDLIAPYHAEKSEWAFKQILNRTQPDIIHIEHFLNWPLAIIDLATKYGVPVVLNFHDYYALTPSYTMQGAEDPQELVSSIYSMRFFEADISDYLLSRRQALMRSFQYVSKLITPSHYLANQLRKVFPYNFTVVENGIQAFTVKDTSRAWPELRFAYLGTDHPQKGWEMLISAFQNIHKTNKDIKLHIYGDITAQNITRSTNLIPDLSGITFHGLYKREDLPQILSKINVGVIPSLFPETYSLVLSELWQGGIVPLVSDIGAMKIRVQDGINGKKFISGDVNSLISALEWFIDNDSWKGWTLPTPRHVTAMGAEYDNIYQKLISEKNSEHDIKYVENS